jgi:hypothetical protein
MKKIVIYIIFLFFLQSCLWTKEEIKIIEPNIESRDALIISDDWTNDKNTSWSIDLWPIPEE